MSLPYVENLFRRFSQSGRCVRRQLEYSFYKQIVCASPVTCASSVVVTPGIPFICEQSTHFLYLTELSTVIVAIIMCLTECGYKAVILH